MVHEVLLSTLLDVNFSAFYAHHTAHSHVTTYIAFTTPYGLCVPLIFETHLLCSMDEVVYRHIQCCY
jgi:hypothetical protein